MLQLWKNFSVQVFKIKSQRTCQKKENPPVPNPIFSTFKIEFPPPPVCQQSAPPSSFGEKGAIKGLLKRLVNYWFYTDHHFLTGNKFRYHDAQKEAIETLIYVYEVKKVRRRKSLLDFFSIYNKGLRLPFYDKFARYCLKMATGSGKTKVMALAIVWQYFRCVKMTSNMQKPF